MLILDSSGDALRWEAGEIDRVGGGVCNERQNMMGVGERQKCGARRACGFRTNCLLLVLEPPLRLSSADRMWLDICLLASSGLWPKGMQHFSAPVFLPQLFYLPTPPPSSASSVAVVSQSPTSSPPLPPQAESGLTLSQSWEANQAGEMLLWVSPASSSSSLQSR